MKNAELKEAFDRARFKEFLNDELGYEGRTGGWIYNEYGRPGQGPIHR